MLSKNALAIPADKLEWTPGGKARTTMDIMAECAGFPQWLLLAIEKKGMPSAEQAGKIKNTLLGEAKTIQALVTILNEETERFCQFVEKFPESRLNEEIAFPWGTYSMSGVFDFHNWNNTYHLGQISYLQLILGDTEMH